MQLLDKLRDSLSICRIDLLSASDKNHKVACDAVKLIRDNQEALVKVIQDGHEIFR